MDQVVENLKEDNQIEESLLMTQLGKLKESQIGKNHHAHQQVENLMPNMCQKGEI